MGKRYSIQARRKDTLSRIIHGYILHKAAHTKGKRPDYYIYKTNHPVTPKQVVNVVDLGYLGVEKDSRTTICTTL
jgi:hypothetical protein